MNFHKIVKANKGINPGLEDWGALFRPQMPEINYALEIKCVIDSDWLLSVYFYY